VELLDDAATWNNYKLVQQSADSYTISKQTKEECAWDHAADGNRAGGLVYTGSAAGGMALGLRNFWKKHPSSFEVLNLGDDEAIMRTWFWSPDAQAMDMRHYDTETHVKSSYEGA